MAVIDASALMRAVVKTPGNEAAIEAIAAEDAMAPDIVAIEAANALWRYVRAGEMDASSAQALLAASRDAIRLVPVTASLLAAALGIACAMRHPVYGCIYVALAKSEEVPLVTADLKLAELARQSHVRIRLLA